LQHVNKMSWNRLTRIIKTTDWTAERIRGDHQRDFWMCETGTSQQVAQLLVSWTTTMKLILKFMTM
jgi:hypothetical protein